MRKKVNIGLTYGDPAGIGPEILLYTLKNWKKFKFKKINPIIIATNGYLTNTKILSGKPSRESGRHALGCLRLAVKFAKKKRIKAIVTSPVSKKIISLSQKNFKGQTDEIARLCDVNPENVIMLFVSNDFRVALFTRHIPVKAVSSKLNKIKFKKFILLLKKELKKWLKIKKPKIAILGLNPHAGEDGLIGNEERKIMIPVIKELSKKGLKISEPYSPDAMLAHAGKIYLKKEKQPYDVYVSIYHDQSLPLFKALAGFSGLNVTLGLPFIRVSPDHGTAFDIAGRNKASPNGLINSLYFLEKIL